MEAYASPGAYLLEEDGLFRLISVSIRCILEIFSYENNSLTVFLSGTFADWHRL